MHLLVNVNEFYSNILELLGVLEGGVDAFVCGVEVFLSFGNGLLVSIDEVLNTGDAVFEHSNHAAVVRIEDVFDREGDVCSGDAGEGEVKVWAA